MTASKVMSPDVASSHAKVNSILVCFAELLRRGASKIWIGHHGVHCLETRLAIGLDKLMKTSLYRTTTHLFRVVVHQGSGDAHALNATNKRVVLFPLRLLQLVALVVSHLSSQSTPTSCLFAITYML